MTIADGSLTAALVCCVRYLHLHWDFKNQSYLLVGFGLLLFYFSFPLDDRKTKTKAQESLSLGRSVIVRVVRNFVPNSRHSQSDINTTRLPRSVNASASSLSLLASHSPHFLPDANYIDCLYRGVILLFTSPQVLVSVYLWNVNVDEKKK